MSEQKVQTAEKYLIFKLDSEEYGIDIEKIVTIVEKNMAIARVPRTQDYIKGVINLRGEIIPVMSVRKRCGMQEIDYNEDTRIIIAKIGEIVLGLIVDSVSEVLSFEEGAMESISNICSLSAEYIFGIGKKDNRIVTLLNLEKLTGIEENINGSN